MKNITKYLNLLLVEDDIEIQENLKKSLELLFNHVYTAQDGEEALKLYKQYSIDIIISDYVLPNMNAYELVSKLRQKDDNVPVILLSSFMDMEKLQKCIPLNLVHFLEKPVSFENLLCEINSSIEKLHKSNKLQFRLNDDVIYNNKSKSFFIKDEEFTLTKYEHKLVELLCLYKKEIVDFKTIINYMNEENEYIDKTTIKNVVYRLRKKLPVDIIISHRNLGYSLKI